MVERTDICVRDDDIAWEDLGQGVQRKLLVFEQNIMMARVDFAAGAVGAPHSHPHVQCAYVEAGTFDLTVDGRTERLSAGDSFIIPTGAVHGVVAVTAGTLIDVFTPMRQDFLATDGASTGT